MELTAIIKVYLISVYVILGISLNRTLSGCHIDNITVASCCQGYVFAILTFMSGFFILASATV